MASLSILAGRRFNPIPRSCILALKSLRLSKKKSDKEVVFSSPVVNNVRDPFWLEYSTNLTWKEELYLPFSISEWQHQSGPSSRPTGQHQQRWNVSQMNRPSSFPFSLFSMHAHMSVFPHGRHVSLYSWKVCTCGRIGLFILGWNVHELIHASVYS